MNSVTSTALGVLGFIVLTLVPAGIRYWQDQNFELRNSDMLFGIIPVVIALLLSGKIVELGFGDMRVAFANASQSAISSEVRNVQLPVEEVSMGAKGGPSMIELMIESKTEALSFQFSRGHYGGSAITEYFRELTSFEFFKYVVILDQEGCFFGMFAARALHDKLRLGSNYLSFRRFAELLNEGNGSELSQIPGFLGLDIAVQNSENRRRVLVLMDSLGTEIIPIVDQSKRFVGVVDRNSLTTKMLIDVTKDLK